MHLDELLLGARSHRGQVHALLRRGSQGADDGNTLGPQEVDGEEVNRLIGWCLTYFTNFSGHPSASIPAGLIDGLPVGMQLIGRRYEDADVLAASAVFEKLRPWRDTYEICADRPL